MPIQDAARKIEARQREIAKEIVLLQEESNELGIALKVIMRLEPDSSAVPEAPTETHTEDETPKLGPPRPSGCPTNFQMVDMILASAEKEGKDGLTISELISEMRTRYWPGLKDVQVSAPIYSFVRQDRLRKTPGGKFKRIKQQDAVRELAIMTPERITSDAPS
jgi:hypothetical protein